MAFRAGSLTFAVLLAILTTPSAWGICEAGGASQPTVGVSYSGPDANGNVTATVSYSFPNTDSYLQRLINVARDGVGWYEHVPENHVDLCRSALLNRTKLLLHTVPPLVLSWLVGAAFPLLPGLSKWQTLPPEVPFVLTPDASGEHVRSSVYYFIVVIGLAGLCAVILEVAKFAATKSEGPLRLYLAFLMQQFLLGADVIRTHAWDWWLFLLSMTGIRPIDEYTWMEHHYSTVGRWPWPSALSGLVILVLCSHVALKGINSRVQH